MIICEFAISVNNRFWDYWVLILSFQNKASVNLIYIVNCKINRHVVVILKYSRKVRIQIVKVI